MSADFTESAPRLSTAAHPGADDEPDISLLDILDHVLNAGVVIQGSIVISLAGVDLVYVGLSVVLTSVETALSHLKSVGDGQGQKNTWRK